MSAPGINFYMNTITLVSAFTNLLARLSPVQVQYLTPWLDLQEFFEQFGFQEYLPLIWNTQPMITHLFGCHSSLRSLFESPRCECLFNNYNLPWDIFFAGSTKTKQKQKQNKKRITSALDRTGFCLFKLPDILNFFKSEKFKDSVSVSNNQYVCRQCVSSEDIIFTVQIGYNCLRGFHKARQ